MSDSPLAPPVVAAFETFPALAEIDGLDHGFVLRDLQTDVATPDRDLALERLAPHYRKTLAAAGMDFDQLALVEQVHGDVNALVGRAEVTNSPGQAKSVIPGADGLITGEQGVSLGIYVADCCAVWLVDPRLRACALLHSGLKGSQLGIAARAIERMSDQLGSDPADLVVQLSPCIRPPAYEADIAAMIVQSCRDCGVPAAKIHDCAIDTASDLERYYSYRAEQGRTGRMLGYVRWRTSADKEQGTTD